MGMTQATSGAPIHFSDAQDAVSAGQSDNSTTTAQDKIDKTAKPVAAGDYIISFFCELKTDTDDTSGCQVSVLVDSQEKAECNWGKSQWHSFSGEARFTFNEGDTPRMQIQFKRIGAAATVSVRRAYVALVPILKTAPNG
jgi:hypothetical protein